MSVLKTTTWKLYYLQYLQNHSHPHQEMDMPVAVHWQQRYTADCLDICLNKMKSIYELFAFLALCLQSEMHNLDMVNWCSISDIFYIKLH